MINPYRQNLLHPCNVTLNQVAAPQHTLTTNNSGLLARVLRHLKAFISRKWHDYLCEAENRRAMEELRSLSDFQLRDMGITHADISRVVRQGKKGV